MWIVVDNGSEFDKVTVLFGGDATKARVSEVTFMQQRTSYAGRSRFFPTQEENISLAQEENTSSAQEEKTSSAQEENTSSAKKEKTSSVGLVRGHADKRRKQALYREGDLVWIHLRKECFSTWRFRNLKPRGYGPFSILKMINDNAYKIELPGHYNVSATFNVVYLSPYKGNSDDEPDSGSSHFQEGEDDADAVNERVNVTNTLGTYFSATNFCGRLG
ncbi:hypothetical protein Tco_0595604 [Tanacetum coccineum]